MFVRELKVAKLTTFDMRISEKYLSNDNMFLSIVRNFLELLFDNGDINSIVSANLLAGVYTRKNFVYAWKRILLDNVLKRYHVLNFRN